jgi:hypothetical protein
MVAVTLDPMEQSKNAIAVERRWFVNAKPLAKMWLWSLERRALFQA